MSDTGGIVFHTPFVVGTPDPAPLAENTPQQARARIEEINADKSNAYWRGFPEAVDEMWRLIQLAGQSQPASSSTNITRATTETEPEESAWPKTVGELLRPDANQPTTPGEAFAAVAPELGLTEDETQAWLTWEKEQPDGEVYSQERELQSWPWDVRQEAARAANAALERLGAGVTGRLIQRGLVHHPWVFTGLVRLGMQLQDIDEEIAAIMKQNPADPRLPALSRKRRGGRVVLKVGE